MTRTTEPQKTHSSEIQVRDVAATSQSPTAELQASPRHSFRSSSTSVQRAWSCWGRTP